jgi:transcriptional regulator with XRE-family HTH domain
MPPSDAGRILQLLNAMIGMRRLRLRDLEGRIGLSAGTLRRILNGTIELKFRHITDLLAVLEIPTKTFFRIAFESDDPDQAQVLLAQALRIAQPESKPVMLSPGQIEEVVLATMKRLGFIPPIDPKLGAEASSAPPARRSKPKARKKPVQKEAEDPEA